MSKLIEADHQSIRNLLANRSFTAAGLAKHGSTHQDLLTANTVQYCIGGKMYTKAAASAIDVSGLDFVDEKGEAVTNEVLATGYQRYWVMALNAAGDFIVVVGDDSVFDTAQNEFVEPPRCPNTLAPFGMVHVDNATGSGFTFGTTALNTSNLTVVYTDISVVPLS